MLTQIIYHSTALYPRGHMTDLDILREALDHNARSGLSGYLIRTSQGFLQAIEGDPQAVRATFDKINRDHRHGSIQSLCDSPRTQRDFDRWDMGYSDVGDTLQFTAITTADHARDLLLAHAYGRD